MKYRFQFTDVLNFKVLTELHLCHTSYIVSCSSVVANIDCCCYY